MMDRLCEWILAHEDWLMARIVQYAIAQGYDRYTSRLPEAWRLSISGLSASILAAIRQDDVDLELKPHDDYASDPAAAFGLREARLHRARGINLSMFLGLFKYYRQSYMDLLSRADFEPDDRDRLRRVLDRFFDRVEIGFCVEWSQHDQHEVIAELQASSRLMTNEKNKFLTLFVSLPWPALILDDQNRVEDINHAAAVMFLGSGLPGSTYYKLPPEDDRNAAAETDRPSAVDVFPWLVEALADYDRTAAPFNFETSVETRIGLRRFAGVANGLLTVTGESTKTMVVLDDITERKRVEEALRRSEQISNALLNAISEAAFLIDLDGTVIVANQETARRFNTSVENLIGKNMFALLPPDVAARRRDFVAQVVLARRPVEVEDERQGRILHSTLYPVFDGQANVSSVAVLGVDVTERKQFEEALKDREEQYRALFDNNHAVMMLVDPDTADIVDVNQAACVYYGFAKEDFVTKRITDINTLSPEQVFQEMDRARLEKRNYFLFRHRLANGEVRDVEVYSGPINVRGKSLLYSVIHDITDRRAAEEALKASEERFRYLMEQSPAAIQFFDLDGVMRQVNGTWSRLWNVTGPSAVIGQYNVLTDPQAQASGIADAVRRAVHGDFTEIAEIHYSPREAGFPGRDRCLHTRVFPLRDHTNHVRYVVITAEDITDRKLAEQDREIKVKLEGVMEMAGAACHELNQPLQVLSGQIELMSMDLPPDDRIRQRIRPIREHLKKLIEITAKIQRITRYATRTYVADQKIIDIEKASE